MKNARQAIVEVAVSSKIKSLVDSGSSIQDAIDSVLGAGTFSKIASEVYDELNAK
jgi:hypothetical protein